MQTQKAIVDGTGGGTRFCEATFVVRGGHVAEVNYRGTSEAAGLWVRGTDIGVPLKTWPNNQCAHIVQNCLR